MSERIGIALICSVGLVLAALALGGRYEIAPVVEFEAPGLVYVIDKFTGHGRVCKFDRCHDLSDN